MNKLSWRIIEPALKDIAKLDLTEEEKDELIDKITYTIKPLTGKHRDIDVEVERPAKLKGDIIKKFVGRSRLSPEEQVNLEDMEDNK